MTSSRRKQRQQERAAEARQESGGYFPAEVVNGLIGDRRADAVDMEELFQEIIAQFGGKKVFAKRIYDDYDQAPSGSVAKQRASGAIIGMMVRQWEAKSKREMDLEGISDEDLRKQAEELWRSRFPPLCTCPGCGLEFVPEEAHAPKSGQGAAEPAPGRAGEGPLPADLGGADPAPV